MIFVDFDLKKELGEYTIQGLLAFLSISLGVIDESIDTDDLYSWMDEMRQAEDAKDYTEYQLEQYHITFVHGADHYGVVIIPNGLL